MTAHCWTTVTDALYPSHPRMAVTCSKRRGYKTLSMLRGKCYCRLDPAAERWAVDGEAARRALLTV